MMAQRYSCWWNDTAPDFSYQSQLPAYAEVVIIGAGIAGLSTAYWLARFTKKNKKTFRIVVLDEAAHPAFKASGRIGGAVYVGSHKTPAAMIRNIGVKATTQLYRYGIDNNRLLFKLIGQGLGCGLESNGGLRMSTTEKELVDLDESHDFFQTKLGVTSARFNHEQSQHIAIAPLTTGSMYIPFEGMLDPFAMCNNLARLLRVATGVSITYGARVRDVGTDENGPFVELSNGHVINAGKVIHTTTKTCQWKELSNNIVYKREHVIRTNPFGEDLDDIALPMMPIELSTDSVRLHGRSMIMTGGKGGMRKDTELGNLDDSDYNKRIFDHLNEDMLKHFPFTNLVELASVWTYIETGTKDSLPVMGEIPTHQGHYLNVAHGRNKLGLAFLGGKNIAESILGTKVDNEDYDIFSPNRFLRGETNVQTV